MKETYKVKPHERLLLGERSYRYWEKVQGILVRKDAEYRAVATPHGIDSLVGEYDERQARVIYSSACRTAEKLIKSMVENAKTSSDFNGVFIMRFKYGKAIVSYYNDQLNYSGYVWCSESYFYVNVVEVTKAP